MRPKKTVKAIGCIQSVKRLPFYLRLFNTFLKEGRQNVSSVVISAQSGLQPILIKKDLKMVRAPGKTGLGYNIKGTIRAIETFLGWHNKDVFLIGCGKLGCALLGYEGFKHHNFNIVAAFDNDPAVVGTNQNGITVLPIERLATLLQRLKISIAIITVPAHAAQGVADTLVSSGVKAIWNFAPADIKVPQDVIVQQEDLSVSVALLSSKLKK